MIVPSRRRSPSPSAYRLDLAGHHASAFWCCYRGRLRLADGVLALGAAVFRRIGKPWWMLTLEGLVGLGAAAVALFYPGVTALVLL